MKSIMFYNSKGGSGKTTLAVNLAAYYAKAGIPTTIVDLDPQQSSMQWLDARPMSKPKVSGTKKFNKLVKRAKNAVVIYDLPAAIYGNKLTSYIKKANIVVVPVLPSPIDMKAAKEFIQSLRAMGSVIRNRVQIGLVAN